MSIHTQPDAKETGRPGAGDQTTAGSETCDHRPSTAYRLQLRSRLIPEARYLFLLARPRIAARRGQLPCCLPAVSYYYPNASRLLVVGLTIATAKRAWQTCSAPAAQCVWCARAHRLLNAVSAVLVTHDLPVVSFHGIITGSAPINRQRLRMALHRHAFRSGTTIWMHNPRRWMVYSTQARARGMETEPLH